MTPDGGGPGRPHHRGRHRRSSSILGGILANGQNIAFLVALAFAVAASANLPTILYTLFWKRFNTRGALWSIYGGLITCVGADHLLAGRLGEAGRPGHRREPVDDHRPTSTSTGSRSTTRASCRSRWRSSSAGSARVTSKEHNAGEVRRDRGPVADRRRRGEGGGALIGRCRRTGRRPAGRDDRSRGGPVRRARGYARAAVG